MYLQRIYVSGFRNLKEQEFFPSQGLNLIIGNNGQGKTNLLEAIYILGLTKSFRTNDREDFICWGGERASIFGEVVSKETSLTLGVLFEKNKRALEVNGENVTSLTDYIGRFITVTFSPLDIAIVRGAATVRRKFLDKHLIDIEPRQLENVLVYQKALSNKQKLLKDPQSTRASLSPWNKILARSGLEIIKHRETFIQKLNNSAKKIHKELAPEDPELNLQLKSSLKEPMYSENEESFYEFLENSAQKELGARNALYGPHRDDLLISLDEIEAKPFASQGQARTIVISLKLAMLSLIEEQKDGDPPVVLLDDVESELDPERRAKLLTSVSEGNRQVVLTGTESTELPRATLYKVHDGYISR